MNWLLSKLEAITYGADVFSVIRLTVFIVIGGILAEYIRFLYNRCSTSVSNSDTVSRVFPLLTMVTIVVIAVVKSSLALSLGLVGALSIVRFRAAIKDPEQLVYLFLCIAVGLSLGAGHLSFAFVLVFVASAFSLSQRFLKVSRPRHNLLLTVSGDATRYFDDPQAGVLGAVQELSEDFSIQRYDVDEGLGLMRVVVRKSTADEIASMIAGLRKRLPDCQVSYLNMDTIL